MGGWAWGVTPEVGGVTLGVGGRVGGRIGGRIG